MQNNWARELGDRYMENQSSRDNHYVPIWYQNRFLKPSQSQYHYLDLSPDPIPLPDGRTKFRKDLLPWGPKSCFCHRDLYTTFFGEQINDEIEKRLFGDIDDRGRRAVEAFSDGDLPAMHRHFSDFFIFLDTQKLRTPKGLAWISSRYGNLNQNQLMREMQGLQFRHCAMWTEGVREIVSAAESDIKFIVSDHPVTVYNPAFEPNSSHCCFPEDPPIELIGTQTIFALGPETCLILTNLEYAEDPLHCDPVARRTNVRYSAQGLARVDAFIRKRKISRDEVIAINHVLKARAKRYIAAAEVSWLYPERLLNTSWRDIAQVLLPKDGLSQFGGEVYVGYADGTTQYQDQFGRTSKAHEYLRRKRVATDPGANDGCGCGSGKKFKHCCMRLPKDARPTWEVFGLRERNLMFCRKVLDILGISDGKSWDDVRREMNDEHVARIHDAFASLWPADTDLTELLPRPDPRIFRAVYLGAPNARTIDFKALSWLAYFDEIVLAHPFFNPIGMKPEYSPSKSPRQHRDQTLKNVFLLFILQPYIDQGMVHLVPDPGDYNAHFRRTTLGMANERAADVQLQEEDVTEFRKLARMEAERFLARLPDDSLRRRIEQDITVGSARVVDQVIAHLRRKHAADELSLLQPIIPGKENAQIQAIKGFALEVSMYLASLTGAAIYTDLAVHWQQLHQLTSAASSKKPGDQGLLLWQDLVFPMEIGTHKILRDRATGRFGEVRSALRRTQTGAGAPRSAATEALFASQLTITAKALSKARPREHDGVALEGHIRISAPPEGFERNEVTRLLLTYGGENPNPRVAMALLVRVNVSKKGTEVESGEQEAAE